MRTASLLFERETLVIKTGIKVSGTSRESSLHLFNHPERTLVLPYNASRPPLLVASDKQEESAYRFLALLSLEIDCNGAGLCATEEYDGHDRVLLFIDTCDTHASRWKGRYLLPPHHDSCLPHAQYAAVNDDADYGLAVCGVGDTLLVLSTAGSLVNLGLGSDGRFAAHPCTKAERTLLATGI